MTRECGTCTACCTVMAVKELKKPGYQTCQHACAAGCAIYNHKPPSCTGWKCLWLDGTIGGDERRRPDQVGVVFSRQGTILRIYEVWPGAFEKNRKQIEFLVGKIQSKYPLIKTRIWFPHRAEPLVWDEAAGKECGYGMICTVAKDQGSRMDQVMVKQVLSDALAV
jgi:hypothetical protein